MTLTSVEDCECSWCGPGECFCTDGPKPPLETEELAEISERQGDQIALFRSQV